MKIITNQKGDEIFIKVIGEVDIDVVKPLWKELSRVVKLNPKTVIMDLSQLSTINSVGIGKILAFYKELNKNNATLKIDGIQKNVYVLFTSTKMDMLIPISMEQSICTEL